MSGHEFGSRQVVVFRSAEGGPRWVVYCPCCDLTLARHYLHTNAMYGARAHARRVHLAPIDRSELIVPPLPDLRHELRDRRWCP